ncbi:eukaryotic translation initiation factor 4E-like [Convolutriloba macropyga]|uniref:eukaryotic translation initiation factor 4E-like n=1 Tax=Convolutriloba macropyga TaxID=536237 RepID=UPI003F523142
MVEISKTEMHSVNVSTVVKKEEPETCQKEQKSGELEYHPLQKTWSLWFKKDQPGATWVGGQKRVHSFHTVEDFWSLFNYIQPANQLSKGSDYSLFKENIEPTWEDPVNKNGGRWIVTINKMKMDEKTNIDKYWLETVLLLIGEGFEDSLGDFVVGAVVSIRGKYNRVAVWITTTDVEVTKSIGETFKARLKIPTGTTIHFQTHKDAQNQTSSAMRHIYAV